MHHFSDRNVCCNFDQGGHLISFCTNIRRTHIFSFNSLRLFIERRHRKFEKFSSPQKTYRKMQSQILVFWFSSQTNRLFNWTSVIRSDQKFLFLPSNSCKPPQQKIIKNFCCQFDVTDFSLNPYNCLLYTSPSPRDRTRSRMPSSA